MLLCIFNNQFWFRLYDMQLHHFLNDEFWFCFCTNHKKFKKMFKVDVALIFLLLCWFTPEKLLRRRYVAVVTFSHFMLLDVTLITKLLKNGKLLKLCYLAEDSKDLKPDVEVIKVLTKDYEVLLLTWRVLISQARR